MGPSVKFVSRINGSLSPQKIMGQLWLGVVVRGIMDLVVVAVANSVGDCLWWWLSCGSGRLGGGCLLTLLLLILTMVTCAFMQEANGW